MLIHLRNGVVAATTCWVLIEVVERQPWFLLAILYFTGVSVLGAWSVTRRKERSDGPAA